MRWLLTQEINSSIRKLTKVDLIIEARRSYLMAILIISTEEEEQEEVTMNLEKISTFKTLIRP
jgi:tRNA(Ser,Leu) C12 N-acetylase TAN1